MRFKEYLNENVFDHSSLEHQAYMQDIDAFTASPRLNLKPATIQYLKSKRDKNKGMTLYRVLFVDDLNKLAKDLNTHKVEDGAHGTHSAKRVSSWSYSESLIMELAVENDDIGEYSVVLKANIPGDAIVLNTDDLSTEDKKHIELFVQKEVIVDEGSYPVTIIDVIDHNE